MMSTLELYGVAPEKLADMSYREALNIMHAGLWVRKGELTEALFATTDGDVASEIQNEYRKVLKAINITDLRIDEIK